MRLKWPSNEQLLFLANVLADRLWFKKNATELKAILFVKWDEIGDMAAAMHVFEAVKHQYPNAKITVVCKPFVKSLIESNGFVDEILTDINAFNRRYDAVVELRGTWQTLLKAFKYRIIYRVSRAEIRLKNKGQQLHETLTNTAVVQLLHPSIEHVQPGISFSPTDEASVNDFLKANGIENFAIIHAGARKKLRQWPKERFALAIEYLHKKYQLSIVFAGSKDDEADIDIIKSDLGFQTFNFTSGFSLSQFANLCSKARIYIGNESGPMQIASNAGIPVIAIYGPGVPHVFYPLSKDSKVLHHVLDCNPCDQIHCVRPDNPCISMVKVDDVLESIDEILL